MRKGSMYQEDEIFVLLRIMLSIQEHSRVDAIGHVISKADGQ
jgi:hypothetical protein